MKRFIPVFLSLVFLASAIIYVGDRNTTAVPAEKAKAAETQQELRGVWVTYMTLDVENEADKASAFKQKINTVVDDMQRANLNTLIIQVRPFCDALYPSRYFPWSHILTGTQGEDPGYDPLDYIIQTAHENGIAVHAWINPYRIRTKDTPAKLSDSHPYITAPSIGVEINGSLYLNPASQKAQGLIVNGVRELAEKYEIDGIQFDDYFYPPDCGDFDMDDYEAYCDTTDSPLSLADFRKENVNTLIKKVYAAAHQARPGVVFGISPQGHLSNNDTLYADVRTWCAEEGYIDYICPQVYFSPDNPTLHFEKGLQDWLELKKHPGLSLYVGLPAYKAGTDADEGTWLDNDDILKTELEIVREKACDGFMLYSYDSFHNEENAAEIQNVIRYLTTSPTQ